MTVHLHIRNVTILKCYEQIYKKKRLFDLIPFTIIHITKIVEVHPQNKTPSLVHINSSWPAEVSMSSLV